MTVLYIVALKISVIIARLFIPVVENIEILENIQNIALVIFFIGIYAWYRRTFTDELPHNLSVALYLRTGSILLPMVYHFIHDWICSVAFNGVSLIDIIRQPLDIYQSLPDIILMIVQLILVCGLPEIFKPN